MIGILIVYIVHIVYRAYRIHILSFLRCATTRFRAASAARTRGNWDTVRPNNAEALSYRREYSERIQRQNESAPGLNSPGIPEGSYLNSCKGCSVQGETLRCQRCNVHGHAPSGSELLYSKCEGGLVDNIHGELQCKPPTNEPDCPNGGYLNSCLGCRLRNEGAVLHCIACGTADDTRRESSVALDKCKSPGKLDNRNGHLVCTGLRHEPNIPEGGYRSSCEGCKVEHSEDLLHCEFCSAADGGQRATSIYLAHCPAPGRIDNSNGFLICDGLPHAESIPSGTFTASCQGCRVSGLQDELLRCASCLAADGTQRESVFDVRQCQPPKVIGNRNGQLACGQYRNSEIILWASYV